MLKPNNIFSGLTLAILDDSLTPDKGWQELFLQESRKKTGETNQGQGGTGENHVQSEKVGI